MRLEYVDLTHQWDEEDGVESAYVRLKVFGCGRVDAAVLADYVENAVMRFVESQEWPVVRRVR